MCCASFFQFVVQIDCRDYLHPISLRIHCQQLLAITLNLPQLRVYYLGYSFLPISKEHNFNWFLMKCCPSLHAGM